MHVSNMSSNSSTLDACQSCRLQYLAIGQGLLICLTIWDPKTWGVECSGCQVGMWNIS